MKTQKTYIKKTLSRLLNFTYPLSQTPIQCNFQKIIIHATFYSNYTYNKTIQKTHLNFFFKISLKLEKVLLTKHARTYPSVMLVELKQPTLFSNSQNCLKTFLFAHMSLNLHLVCELNAFKLESDYYAVFWACFLKQEIQTS